MCNVMLKDCSRNVKLHNIICHLKYLIVQVCISESLRVWHILWYCWIIRHGIQSLEMSTISKRLLVFHTWGWESRSPPRWEPAPNHLIQGNNILIIIWFYRCRNVFSNITLHVAKLMRHDAILYACTDATSGKHGGEQETVQNLALANEERWQQCYVECKTIVSSNDGNTYNILQTTRAKKYWPVTFYFIPHLLGGQ